MGKVKKAPFLTSETLQERELNGTTCRGGDPRSLTKCAAKLGALNAKLNAPGGSNDLEMQTIQDEIKLEIQLFQIEMHKRILMIQRAEQELKDVATKEQQIASAVEQKQRDIQELRNQAAKVARTRKCWKEYETLARLVRKRKHCRIMQAELDMVHADLEKTKNQLKETAEESKMREKQFHVLIQVMLDLKRGLTEPVEIPPEKKEGYHMGKSDRKPPAAHKSKESLIMEE